MGEKQDDLFTERPLRWLILGLVLLAAGIWLAGPLWDIDLWWHLATGRFIFENQSLLSEDPFTWTSGEITAYRELVLNGYWLAQLVFYGFYALFDDYGLIAVRVLILVTLLGFGYFSARKRGATFAATIPLLVLAAWLISEFGGTRPQLFSFLLTPVVLYLLDKAWDSCRRGRFDYRAGTMLTLAMLVWANLHRGFMIGSVLIGLYVAAEGLGFVLAKRRISVPHIWFGVFSLLAVAATLLNPNGYGPYLELLAFQGTELQQRSSEYLSPLTLLTRHGRELVPYWILLIQSILVVGLSWKRVRWTHLAIVGTLAVLSLQAFRYVPFFVFATLPLSAVWWTGLADRAAWSRRCLQAAALAGTLGAVVLAVTLFQSTLGATMRNPLSPGRFPEAAAEFLASTKPRGNMFNHFNWGGYLGWRLYPDQRVFVDGRALNLETLSDYTYILWDRPVAARLLDAYDIRLVVMPERNPFTGEPYELVPMLLSDPRWRVVFRDEVATVFTRRPPNGPAPQAVH